MKDKEYHVANFATFVSKLLLFPPKNWMNLISDRLSIASIKYLNWPSPVFGRFQNGCNKVVIEPRVVQFWSEIILVISNRTRAARSFDFENHAYGFSPNCTPLSAITIIYQTWLQTPVMTVFIYINCMHNMLKIANIISILLTYFDLDGKIYMISPVAWNY